METSCNEIIYTRITKKLDQFEIFLIREENEKYCLNSKRATKKGKRWARGPPGRGQGDQGALEIRKGGQRRVIKWRYILINSRRMEKEREKANAGKERRR